MLWSLLLEMSRRNVQPFHVQRSVEGWGGQKPPRSLRDEPLPDDVVACAADHGFEFVIAKPAHWRQDDIGKFERVFVDSELELVGQLHAELGTKQAARVRDESLSEFGVSGGPLDDLVAEFIQADQLSAPSACVASDGRDLGKNHQ